MSKVKSRNVSSKIDTSQKVANFGNIDQKIVSDGNTFEYFEIPNLLKSSKNLDDTGSLHDSLEGSDFEDDSLDYGVIPNISFFTGNEDEEVHHDFEDDESQGHGGDTHLETITEEQEFSGRNYQFFFYFHTFRIFY